MRIGIWFELSSILATIAFITAQQEKISVDVAFVVDRVPLLNMPFQPNVNNNQQRRNAVYLIVHSLSTSNRLNVTFWLFLIGQRIEPIPIRNTGDPDDTTG